MKHHSTAILALCSLAIAAPSPLHEQQQQQPQRLSRWASIKQHFLQSVLGFEQTQHAPIALSKDTADRRVPAHTAARYGGDLVLRFNISTSEESGSLAEAADTLMLDVWEFAHDWVDIRLSKDSVPLLLGLLPDSLQHAHKPLMREKELSEAIIANYQKSSDQKTSVDAQPTRRPFNANLEQTTEPETNIFFADYQPFNVIEPWLRLMASLFTTHVTHIDIGLSYEGRSIPAVRVGVHPTNSDDPNPPRRKTILVVGSLHAREWISTTTVNYVAYSMITGYGKDHSITQMLEKFDFVFIPTLNPDGYIYTWETDRLWRKNRQQTGIRFCQGMDLDRSFGFEWSATDNPCSESYTGEAPFQAVEAKNLADWAKNETENKNVEFVGFLDLHSYSQEVLYPYSYSCDDEPPGLENLEELAVGLAKSIRTTHGRNYEVMSACEGNSVFTAGNKKVHLKPSVEATGGSALDFFYRTIGVRYAYQLKLRDRGTYGFLLPREHIIPTGKEIFNAVLYFSSFLDDLYNLASDEKKQQPSLKLTSSYTAKEERIISMMDKIEDGSLTEADIDALSEEKDEPWVVVEDLGPDDDDAKHDLKRRRRK
ncbi:Putative peptidase M14, carboxypeptidase A [Septoria linicola]|uniref:Inactive metallocarboxypeptidase ECM14 n=1 Tax=Septoria linicola TaxID=215465 RepID=A0A9Q9EKD3_9PEZI|nr:putative peptidase M14, carboxypeptidase A [Septoria linicola]USW52278.1 Putative peptidase M14, carboxypeptidase A [Septoria linicola]